jgi:type I restriction enzyme S subunit
MSGCGRLASLLDGWTEEPLGDLVHLHNHLRVPVKADDRRPGPYPYCGANGVVDHIDSFKYDGSYVLVAEDAGYWGPNEPSAYQMSGKFWVNNHAHVLTVKSGVSQRFLHYALVHTDMRPWITGSTRGKLTRAALQQVLIPVPPLKDQRRIADLLAAADSAVATALIEVERFSRLRSSALSGLLTATHERWPQTRVDVAADVNPEGLQRKGVDGEINYIDIAAVTADGIERARVKQLPLNDAPSRAQRVVRQGDVIISTVRPYLRARALVADDMDGFVTSTGFCVLRPKPTCVPGYLDAVTSSEAFYAHLESRQSGSAYPAVRPADIADALITFPPEEEQLQIATLLGALDTTRQHAAARCGRLVALRESLLATLISGTASIPASYDRFLADENPAGAHREPATG